MKIKHRRISIFLFSLLAFLTLYPYLHHKFPNQIAVVEFFFAILMISGVSLFNSKRKLLMIMGGLSSFILVGILVLSRVESEMLLFIVISTELLFFIIIFISLLGYIYDQTTVTLSKLYAAVTCYLVLGIIFAVVYTLISIFSVDVFQYAGTLKTSSLQVYPHPEFFSEALYYSFVTLSTLGYGDWVPTLGPVKMIASLEAITGQLYIAILIARLVGIQIAQTLMSKKNT